MNTKLSIALLSGISLFMSIGAFAVSDEPSSDYLNWSYAMGDLAPARPQKQVVDQATLPVSEAKNDSRDCTVGCPGRPQTDDVEALTLTYEDEAAPVIERIETFSSDDRFVDSKPVSRRMPPEPVSADVPPAQPSVNVQPVQPSVNTQYVQSPTKVQYPITRQYPISVQYPVTVQRNMTVEQPVVMQQPVIVRRPVVMQQDITVQRQPAVIQQQPVIMQQQPTFVQQQPITIQTPFQMPVNMMNLPTFGYMPQPAPMIPTMIPAPIPQAVMPQPVAQMGMIPAVQAQPYYVQGQVMVQPVYAPQPYTPAGQSDIPNQQAGYPNTTY